MVRHVFIKGGAVVKIQAWRLFSSDKWNRPSVFLD